jgi:hypothetical protein
MLWRIWVDSLLISDNLTGWLWRTGLWCPALPCLLSDLCRETFLLSLPFTLSPKLEAFLLLDEPLPRFANLDAGCLILGLLLLFLLPILEVTPAPFVHCPWQLGLWVGGGGGTALVTYATDQQRARNNFPPQYNHGLGGGGGGGGTKRRKGISWYLHRKSYGQKTYTDISTVVRATSKNDLERMQLRFL